jgi:hypothetical protein
MALKGCVEQQVGRLMAMQPAVRAEAIAQKLAGVVDWTHAWKLLDCAEPAGAYSPGHMNQPEHFPVPNASDDELAECRKLVWQVISDPSLPETTVGLKLVRDRLRIEV